MNPNDMFKPMKKGSTYFTPDWERMLQELRTGNLTNLDKVHIELITKIVTARALDHIYEYGITTQQA